MTTISNALQAVHTRISRALAHSGRACDEVLLLAVSKQVAAPLIRDAYAAGQRAFGESYVQEALAKMAQLRDLAIEWHFLGPLQSNKTKLIAEHFAWAHSLDRFKLAQRLSDQRPLEAPPLNICLQVNVSGEASKSGVAPEEVAALAAAVRDLPRLKLRGLMTIPAPSAEASVQRAQCNRMWALHKQLNAQGYALDTLSMGMSGDLEIAIAEGATIVRVGTAIFGERPSAPE